MRSTTKGQQIVSLHRRSSFLSIYGKWCFLSYNSQIYRLGKNLPVCLIDREFSTCPSVCPVDRQQQRRLAGLLLSALRAGDIDRLLRDQCGRRAAGAGAQQQMQTASCREPTEEA